MAQFEKIYKTMLEVGLLDPTLVIHDWGSFIGYNMLHIYPGIANRVISFDIGSGGTPNVTYVRASTPFDDLGSAVHWSERSAS